jgi:SagB-type dehydrogenase family enzyme
MMNLPTPGTEGTLSLEQALKNRRTVRAFGAAAIDPSQLSQLLWAAQGITADRGALRAAPSAGALYPMDVYVAVGKKGVNGIEAGVYHYGSRKHRLFAVSGGDVRKLLARAALSQNWVARAPISLVITAEYRRITGKYGKRGVRYAMIEAGHIGQNVFLQAEALGLKAGIVGAFDDKGVNRTLNIPLSHEPLLVMPIGYRR